MTRAKPIDEFSSYTLLGSDGIGHIVTVASTPAEAEELVAGLRAISEKEWSEFIGKG